MVDLVTKELKNLISSENKALIDNDFLYAVNNPRINNVISVYLNTNIDEQKHYRDLFNLLREADSTDTFIIYMNNFGGYVHTGIEIINSFRSCSGQILTVLSGPVYSMAPLIALQGDMIFVEDNTFMMFHDYSGSTEGKGHEMASSILNDRPFFNDFFKRMTHGFLTKEEINKVLKGEDLYVRKASIIKRLRKLGKLGNDN